MKTILKLLAAAAAVACVAALVLRWLRPGKGPDGDAGAVYIPLEMD